MAPIGPNRVVLAFGSNIGDRHAQIQEALDLLNQRCGQILQVSSFHETNPEGFESDHLFINGCLLLKTSLDPFELLENLKQIEKELGRKKTKEGYEDRCIDLDIIFYESLVLNDERLQIPHPKYQQREFVLKPLLELDLSFTD
ncbi:MAG: 2-amino-4-hydroxy-6-hydroxymethyldihydropteridine diphosphokinase [Flavobacteriales bacterium]